MKFSFKTCLMVASNELVHHVIGLAVSKCKGLPSILWSSCLALCTPHFYSLLPQFLKRGKICLPPRGVARINKLQSTLNNLDKISSDRLKHCHDHSITSRCCSSKDKRAGLEISSKPPTWRVIARPKTYILIFKLSVVLYQSHLAERDFVWTHKAPELAQQKATALNH